MKEPRSILARKHTESLAVDENMAGRRRAQAEDAAFHPSSQADEPSQTGARTVASKAYDVLTPDEKQKKVADCVRYLLCISSKKTPFTLSDISENVLGGLKHQGKAAEPVLNEAANELRKIFGLEVVVLPASDSKDQPPAVHATAQDAKAKRQHIILNALSPEYFKIIQPDELLPEMALLLVILSVVLLHQGEIAQDTLWAFLNRLHIDQKAQHATFGDANGLIENEFVRQQKYLAKLSRVEGEAQKIFYRWGPRAKAEFTPKGVLAFAAKIYGEDVNVWMRQLNIPDDGTEVEATSQAAMAQTPERDDEGDEAPAPQAAAAATGRSSRSRGGR